MQINLMGKYTLISKVSIQMRERFLLRNLVAEE